MKIINASGTIPGCILLLALTLTTLILVTLPSCNRNKKGITSLSRPEPPPLPAPPPKIPSMTGSDTTWDMVNQIPMFPGGEELLTKYIAKNTNYPEAAKLKGLQGKVIVKFRITSRGNVNGYEITKSVCPELDAEALRVVRTITRFEPAIVDGKPVSAWYYLPITFTLR